MINLDLLAGTINFVGGYKPHVGPLPTLSFPLKGLWTHDGVVLMAIFEAAQIPVHEHEPILHRYEDPPVAHPGQAQYRYFTVQGHAGMVISPRWAKRNLPGFVQLWASPASEANSRDMAAFKQVKSEEELAVLALLEVQNEMGTDFGPIGLCLDVSSSKKEETLL